MEKSFPKPESIPNKRTSFPKGFQNWIVYLSRTGKRDEQSRKLSSKLSNLESSSIWIRKSRNAVRVTGFQVGSIVGRPSFQPNCTQFQPKECLLNASPPNPYSSSNFSPLPRCLIFSNHLSLSTQAHIAINLILKLPISLPSFFFFSVTPVFAPSSPPVFHHL